MTKLLLVAAGGAVGSVMRYVLAGWSQKLATTTFPVGTLSVNVLGCLLIGILSALFSGPVLVRDEYRVAVMVGALGGFTTFSTYGMETMALANDGSYGRACRHRQGRRCGRAGSVVVPTSRTCYALPNKGLARRNRSHGMTKLLLVAAGGAVGSVMRYVLAGWSQKLATTTFPVGTLSVNVLGCLLIGILSALFSGPVLVRDEYRVAVMVGALGGFTTFSTYGMETMALANDGSYGRACLNIVVTNALALGAVWIGYRVAQRWIGV